MQVASEKTVLGNFDDAKFTHLGVTSRFFKRNGKFFVHTEGPDGKLADFKVQYTFGAVPLQQYLVASPGGRLQALTIAWDTEKELWFHLYPDEKIPHDDPLHWTGLYQNWNAMCAECHSTNLKKHYDATTDTYQTTWDEINVSCQACHGPGKAHVEWAKGLKDAQGPEYTDKRLLIDFKTPSKRVEACARCHSRRQLINDEFKHGSPLMDNIVPALLREGLYYADGQILDEVYVYGSFLQSKMYQTGVVCTDCHNPHTLKLKARGNALCVRCHQQQPIEKFKTLQAKNYDSPAHHFHETGSAGTQCVNCHMPANTYMVIDDRRDHSFRVPRPDLSVKLGTPNACNTCHTDQTAQWAADAVTERYGPKRQQDPHYAEAIAAGRAGIREAESALTRLTSNAQQSAIVRATALELLRRYGPEGVAAMVAATKDADPLVRATAVGGLDRLPPKPRLASVTPLLKDPIRAVRIQAARVLASVPPDMLDSIQRRAFKAALTEYKEAQMAMADLPPAHLNLAVIHERTGRPDLAEQSYQTAIRMNPGFLPARFNLANLYNRLGRNQDAEGVLREGIERVPDHGELYYSLGLLLAEMKRLDEAVDALGKAVALLPERARVRYNYALTLQHLGRRAEAEAAMLQAHQIDPRDPRIVYALAISHVQERKWDQALLYAQKLVELSPGAPGPRRLVQQIQKRANQ